MLHRNSLTLLVALITNMASQQAWSQSQADPKLTEIWQPVPPSVTAYPVPSDAIVLFDGSNLNQWQGQSGKPQWEIEGDTLTIVPGTGGLASKQKFCDIQLHLEWRSPAKEPIGKGQEIGNSGIYLQGRYEVQILDSYENETYVNGQAASIYKQSAPLVNATAKTGEWNSYDIIYKAPTFSVSGELLTPAFVTVLHNGVLVQNHFEIQGKTTYRGEPKYQAHGCAPLYLQEHQDKVSFRNIWVREL